MELARLAVTENCGVTKEYWLKRSSKFEILRN